MNDQDNLSNALATVTASLKDGSNPGLLQEIEALNKALEASEKTMTLGSAIVTTDLMEMAKPFLSEASQALLSKKATGLVEVIDLENEKVTECLFLGVHVRTDKVEEGVKAIAEQINLISAAGLGHSVLAPILSVPLVKLSGKHYTCAVVAYVHVPAEKAEDVRKMCKHLMNADDLGQALHSLDIELPEGEFFAFERISIAANMIEGADHGEALKGLIDMYLGVLPKGTELVSAERCGITDLSIPVELRFKSPILDRVKEVRLQWVRGCGTNSGELKQANILLGIQYIDKDGKDIYEGCL